MTDTDTLQPSLPDARARERTAADLDTSLLVEAGAGSGKTTELVNRMVGLLSSGLAAVHEIAAVTFTRKAAAELRERFQARLEERVREPMPPEEVDPARWADARDRLDEALRDIDQAFIGTIHSFCARLLRERPLEVGLDPAFEELAVEERLTVRRHFWEGYMERLSRDDDPDLEALAGAGLRVSMLFDLFGHLVENPDVDFTADIVDAPPVEDMARTRVALEGLVDRGWELMPERIPDKDWDALQKVIRKLHFMREVTGWRERTDFFDALALVCKDGPRGHGLVQKRWKDRALAKAFGQDVDAFGVGDTAATRLLGHWYEYRYALAVRLVRRAAGAFWDYRRRAGRLDFQDLLVLTAELLRTDPGVRRELGLRYRRILVDEFQDTDPLQAEIMLLIASEPDPDEVVADWRAAVPRPGALFVVGDPKQSIYRFRRADIQLYQFVKERFRSFGGVLELTTNFRSRPPIGALVNDLFRDDAFFPDEATAEQAAFEPLETRPSPGVGDREGVFHYYVGAEAGNRQAIAEDDAARVASWIRGRVDEGTASPGDFLLLTRTRSSISRYARALEDRALAVQVTGAGIGVEEELSELRVLLECMIDPTNPVKVVATLVGLFFGLDYERLLAHRSGGGTFDAMRPREGGDAEVRTAIETLHAWWRASTREPADVFVSRLVSDIGLLPLAAAGELGSLRAGALVFALDTVRAAALVGEASLPGALEVLDSALMLAEAEAPLEPGRTDAVRVMNLHQAKGLEAEIVVLVDPTGDSDRTPTLHVHRTPEGSARGYLKLSEARGRFRGVTTLARARGWAGWEATERRFARAEEVRLLYVAVTRAKRELTVARRTDRPDTSPWSALEPWLDAHAELLELEPVDPPPGERLGPEWVAAGDAEAERAAARIRDMGRPGYVHTSVTEVAKGEEVDEGGATQRGGHAVEAAPGARPDRAGEAASAGPDAEAEQVFRGYSWGSAVHAALALPPGDEDPGALRTSCRTLLVEHGRPLDDHGDPVELAELVELVRAVRGSEIWRRAGVAARVLMEVPFAVPDGVLPEPAASSAPLRPSARARPRRQLDLFAEPTDDAPAAGRPAGSEGADDGRVPRVLEGVIDLVFEEPEGWVVVDYKTDLGTDPRFPARLRGYRRQVDLYAAAWTSLTGDPVKERILFFTAQDRVERW